MIRSKRVNAYSDNAVLNEYYGLSTDTKPTENVATGSIFIEVDTGATFLYDEEGEDWTEVQSGSGGGGGGDSDFSTAEVTFTGSTTDAAVDGAFYNSGDPSTTAGGVTGGESAQDAVNLILYKGTATVMITPLHGFNYSNIVATGNVQEIDSGIYIVTGNCNFEILS